MRCLLLLALVSLLSACINRSFYLPASKTGFGYDELKLDNGRYQVSFSVRGDDETFAMEHALLRAAELTQEEGLLWFDVISEEFEIVRNNPMDVSQVAANNFRKIGGSCGPTSGTSNESCIGRNGLDLNLGNSHSKMTIILLINMLPEKPASASASSFSAAEVIKNSRMEQNTY